ncbi:MAG: tetratricopeptide repeat protein [Candidatus Polarisedimenticolia bacterium]
MPQASPQSPIDRAATLVLAAALFLMPLLHSTRLLDPIHFPKVALFALTALLLAAGALVSRHREEGPERLASPVFWLAGVAALSAGVASLVALNRGLAIWGFLEIGTALALIWGVSRFARAAGQAALLAWAVLAGAALVSLGVLAQVFVPGFHLTPGGWSILPPSRAGAGLGDAALAAEFLLLSIPAGIGAAALSRGWWRVAAGGLLGLPAAALVFAGRQEGWIVGGFILTGIVATRLLQVLLGDRRLERLSPDLGGNSLKAWIACLIVVTAVVAMARSGTLSPTGGSVAPASGLSLLSPGIGDPVADRAAAVPRTLRLAARHPLGVGPDNFRHAFLEIAWQGEAKGPFSASHQPLHAGNSFAELAAEIGVAGGAAVVLLILVLLIQSGYAALRAPYPWDALGFAAFNLFLAGIALGWLASPFQSPAPLALFGLFAGLTQIAALHAPPAAGRLARLLPSVRTSVPRVLRRPLTGAALALAWLAAAGGIGYLGFDRARGLVLGQRGLAHLQAGDPHAAILALGQPAARRLPDHLPRAAAANAYLRLGFLDQAVREFGETLERSPYFVSAWLGRGAVRQEQGRYDQAEEDLKRALEIWPDNAETVMAMGRLSTARGRLDAALEQFGQAIRLDRAIAEPYYRMGEIFTRRGQLDEAIEAFRICGMKDPRYPGLQIATGNAFSHKGLIEMALRYYQAAAAADPRAVEPRLKIASAHHGLGQFCMARTSLEAARDLEGDLTRRNAILDLIARVEADCRKEKQPAPRRR